MRREVDPSCKLSLLIATSSHEKLAWKSWKKNILHSTSGITGKSLFVEQKSFRLHGTKSCINVVSAVKYSEKKEIVKFLNQLMNQNWEKPTYSSWRSVTSFVNHFSLARLREWHLWLEMINTLIINFRRFDWISAVSRKVLTLLESALRYFEVLTLIRSVANKYD